MHDDVGPELHPEGEARPGLAGPPRRFARSLRLRSAADETRGLVLRLGLERQPSNSNLGPEKQDRAIREARIWKLKSGSSTRAASYSEALEFLNMRILIT